jgi:hypothetical protein
VFYRSLSGSPANIDCSVLPEPRRNTAPVRHDINMQVFPRQLLPRLVRYKKQVVLFMYHHAILASLNLASEISKLGVCKPITECRSPAVATRTEIRSKDAQDVP